MIVVKFCDECGNDLVNKVEVFRIFNLDKDFLNDKIIHSCV